MSRARATRGRSAAVPRTAAPGAAATRAGSVLVLGAGMAGLTVARALTARGFSVTVLEARDRIGGRIWTDRRWADLPIDLGAAWIHGTTANEVAAAARAHHLPMRPTDYYAAPTLFDAKGKAVLETELASAAASFERVLVSAARLAAARRRDGPLAEVLAEAIARHRLPDRARRVVAHMIHSQIEQEYATEAGSLSCWYWDEAVDFRGSHVIIDGGFDRLAQAMAAGLTIEFSQVVERIESSESGVRVTTRRGVWEAERAVVTLPLGVLKSGAVTFDPPLPKNKAAAIAKLGVGVLDKVVLRFPRRFWPGDCDWFEQMDEDPRSATELFNLAKYVGLPILVALQVGARAAELESLADEAIVARLMDRLRVMFGPVTVEPEAWAVTRWAADPFSHGSYVHLPPTASGADLDVLAQPVGARLFFAGEATDRKLYGTVQAAMRSGERAAKELALSASNAAVVAARRSDLYHVSLECLDAAAIKVSNRVLGASAKVGRRRHPGCPRRS